MSKTASGSAPNYRDIFGSEPQIRFVPRHSAAYPARMEPLPGMPGGLYVTGELPSDDVPSAAVVGARMCSSYGKNTAYEIGGCLAMAGIQVISGMALGIDGHAMRGALDAGGRTFGVLGGGADICYPASNRDIYARLEASGGIISEQAPGTPPLPQYFPARNRIISALADLVIVVEARERSGSLITVDMALDQGRSIMAVPGRVGDSLSTGCNRLIAQGASILLTPGQACDEVIELFRAMKPADISGHKKSGHSVPADLESRPEADIESRPAAGLESGPAATVESDPAAGPDSRPAADLSALTPLARSIHMEYRGSSFTAEEAVPRLGVPASFVFAALVELQISGLAIEQARGHFYIP